MSLGQELLPVRFEGGELKEDLHQVQVQISETEGNHRALVWYKNNSAHLQHQIVRGQVPFTWHKDDSYKPERQNALCFRDVKDGKALYNKVDLFQSGVSPASTQLVIPYYYLPSPEELVVLQWKARGRDLVGTFDVENVSNRHGKLSHLHQLKVWHRPHHHSAPEITFTFFAHLGDSKHSWEHLEFNVSWFERQSTLKSGKKLIWKFNTAKSLRKDSQQKDNGLDVSAPRRFSHGSSVISWSRSSRSSDVEQNGQLVYPRSEDMHHQKLEIGAEKYSKYEKLEFVFTAEKDAENFVNTCVNAAELSIDLRTRLDEIFRNRSVVNSGLSSPVINTSIGLGLGSFNFPTKTPRPRTAESVDWWRKLNRLRDKCFTFFDDEEPVRVAIIDTGIDATNPWIRDNWRRNSTIFPDGQYRDFSQDSAVAAGLPSEWQSNYEHHRIERLLDEIKNRQPEEPSDISGHGTHMAGILLQLAPFANIFVSKVIEKQEVLEKEEMLKPRVEQAARAVALAILYAVTVWKVQIITLSIGFVDDSEFLDDAVKGVVRQAIRYAVNDDVVVFAAASNSGNRESLAFPANERDLVICMNSSDGNGGRSKFNPPTQDYHTSDNFSILGEEVLSTWKQNENRQDFVDAVKTDGSKWRICKGTSVATAIAASSTAIVHQFGRQYGLSSSRYQSPSAIRRIFWHMSSRATDDRFHDIVPWQKGFSPDSIKGIIKAN